GELRAVVNAAVQHHGSAFAVLLEGDGGALDDAGDDRVVLDLETAADRVAAAAVAGDLHAGVSGGGEWQALGHLVDAGRGRHGDLWGAELELPPEPLARIRRIGVDAEAVGAAVGAPAPQRDGHGAVEDEVVSVEVHRVAADETGRRGADAHRLDELDVDG